MHTSHENTLTVPFSQKLLRISAAMITFTVWTSSMLFGLYILAFYAAALYEGDMERWNGVLPRLYETQTTSANAGIGLHFAAGGIILILGAIQLMEGIRDRFPAFHRWTGRLYVVSCLFAAVGGLVFILIKGTIGGTVMDIGFGLYGLLMFIAAVQTWRHALAGNFEIHRAWGLRLFALAIGSWLYRMDYGFWLLFKGGGHTNTFSGPFDHVMAFFFYLPNLVITELFLRGKGKNAGSGLRYAASAGLILATLFLLTGTYFFTRYYWGPAILSWITG